MKHIRVKKKVKRVQAPSKGRKMLYGKGLLRADLHKFAFKNSGQEIFQFI